MATWQRARILSGKCKGVLIWVRAERPHAYLDDGFPQKKSEGYDSHLLNPARYYSQAEQRAVGGLPLASEFLAIPKGQVELLPEFSDSVEPIDFYEFYQAEGLEPEPPKGYPPAGRSPDTWKR